jgi:hypothetical protein
MIRLLLALLLANFAHLGAAESAAAEARSPAVENSVVKIFSTMAW